MLDWPLGFGLKIWKLVFFNCFIWTQVRYPWKELSKCTQFKVLTIHISRGHSIALYWIYGRKLIFYFEFKVIITLLEVPFKYDIPVLCLKFPPPFLPARSVHSHTAIILVKYRIVAAGGYFLSYTGLLVEALWWIIDAPHSWLRAAATPVPLLD